MMKTNLNWSKLYAQGRCKEIGVPWSAEEEKALQEIGEAYSVSAPYVRSGVKTRKEYEELIAQEVKTGEVPLERRSIEELRILAAQAGLQITDQTPQSVLANLLKSEKKVAGLIKDLDKTKDKAAKEANKAKIEADVEAKAKAEAEAEAAKKALEENTKSGEDLAIPAENLGKKSKK